jgi:tRNA(Arg) A34 adenosine deaminase TadA
MQERFMRRAIELSRTHMLKGDGGPFGAVVVMDGVIVAEGWNSVVPANDPTAHAEVMAIRNACRKLECFSLAGAELYTSCEPCPMCLSATYWARIDRVYYASTKDDAARHQFDDAFIYLEIPKAPAERSIAMVNLLRDEARGVFDEWDRLPGKVPY